MSRQTDSIYYCKSIYRKYWATKQNGWTNERTNEWTNDNKNNSNQTDGKLMHSSQNLLMSLCSQTKIERHTNDSIAKKWNGNYNAFGWTTHIVSHQWLLFFFLFILICSISFIWHYIYKFMYKRNEMHLQCKLHNGHCITKRLLSINIVIEEDYICRLYISIYPFIFDCPYCLEQMKCNAFYTISIYFIWIQ